MTTQTYQVGNGVTATQVAYAGNGPQLVWNQDLVNNIYIGDTNSIRVGDTNVVAVGPNTSVVVNGNYDLFATTNAAKPVAVAVVQGGMSTFLSVTEANGAFVGSSFRFYSGVPANGDLVAAIFPATLPGTDPVGNELLPGMAAYNPAIAAIQMNNGQLEYYAWNGSAWVGVGVVTGSTAAMVINSLSGDVDITSHGLINLQKPVQATAGTAANPTLITTDVVNNASLAYVNGWTAAAVGTDLMFTLTNDDMVHISGRLINPNTVSGASNITNALQSAYQPARDEPVYAYAHASASPFAEVPGFVLVRSTGVVEFFGTFGSADTLEIAGRYPLNF